MHPNSFTRTTYGDLDLIEYTLSDGITVAFDAAARSSTNGISLVLPDSILDPS